MELRQLQYIVTIAGFGSMTKAAEQLHISQSALSLSYQKLERELGVVLFERRGRNLVLTQEGRLFCEKAAGILKQAEELRTSMEQYGKQRQNRIIIASDAVDYSNETVLRFSAIHPDLRFDQLRQDSAQTQKALLDGRADFALTLEDASSSSVFSELLLDEPMLVLISKESPLARQRQVSMTQLRGTTLISQQEGYAVNTLIYSFYQKAWVLPGSTLAVGDPETIVMQVRRGAGISFIPESVFHMQKKISANDMEGCIALPLSESYCRRQVYLTVLKSKKLSPICQEYIQYLRQFGVLTQKLHCFPSGGETGC